jgi:hypothetical protein
MSLTKKRLLPISNSTLHGSGHLITPRPRSAASRKALRVEAMEVPTGTALEELLVS